MLKIHTKIFRTVAVLELQGQIVNGQAEILRNAVQSLAEVTMVKLDLARVTTVDAAGLGLMLELREQVQANGIRFELMNVSPQIGRVFEVTRLDTVFQITPRPEFVPAIRSSLRVSSAPLASCA